MDEKAGITLVLDGMEDAPMGRQVVRLRLTAVLKQLGISQKELAHRAGLSQNTISNLANDPARISLDTIGRLMDATGLGLDQLFGVVEEQKPEA